MCSSKLLSKAVAILLTVALFIFTLPMQALAEELNTGQQSEQHDEYIPNHNEEEVLEDASKEVPKVEPKEEPEEEPKEEQESTTEQESELSPDENILDGNNNVSKEAEPVIIASMTEEMNESPIIGEDLERREKHVKHFIKEDKTYEAAIYPAAVHYMENGVWKDIDNTLVEGTDEDKQQVLTNKNNSYKVKLAKSVKSNKLVRVEKDGYEISWNMETIGNSLAKQDPIKPKANSSSQISKKN